MEGKARRQLESGAGSHTRDASGNGDSARDAEPASLAEVGEEGRTLCAEFREGAAIDGTPAGRRDAPRPRPPATSACDSLVSGIQDA